MNTFDDLPRLVGGDVFELPLMPLREVVMFPNNTMPLFVGRESSIKAVESALANYNKKICLVVQREPDIEKPQAKDLYPVGVVSRVLQLLRLPEGTIKVLFEGLERVQWLPVSEGKEPFGSGPFPRVFVEPVPYTQQPSPHTEARVRTTQEAV